MRPWLECPYSLRPGLPQARLPMWMAAMLYAVIILTKLFSLVWVPLFAVQRRWGFLAATAACICLLFLCSLSFTTIDDWLYYPTQLSATHYARFGSPLAVNVSIKHGLLLVLSQAPARAPALRWVVSLLPFCGLYLLLLRGARRRTRPGLQSPQVLSAAAALIKLPPEAVVLAVQASGSLALLAFSEMLPGEIADVSLGHGSDLACSLRWREGSRGKP